MTLWWIRFKRLMWAASAVGLVLLGILVGAAALMLTGGAGQTSQIGQRPISGVLVGFGVVAFGVAVVIAIFQTWEKYVRATYNPTWTLKYQDLWEQAVEKRSKAAETIKSLRKELENIEKWGHELAEIDDALDILEDIGFYVNGSQISPESAHHHFYHWIRGYYQLAKPYLEAQHKDEPKRWRNIKFLYDVTRQVEKGFKEDIQEEDVFHQAPKLKKIGSGIKLGAPVPQHKKRGVAPRLFFAFCLSSRRQMHIPAKKKHAPTTHANNTECSMIIAPFCQLRLV
jgi:hypothetical protein